MARVAKQHLYGARYAGVWEYDPRQRAIRMGIDVYDIANFCRSCGLWLNPDDERILEPSGGFYTRKRGGGGATCPVCGLRCRTVNPRSKNKTVKRVD